MRSDARARANGLGWNESDTIPGEILIFIDIGDTKWILVSFLMGHDAMLAKRWADIGR